MEHADQTNDGGVGNVGVARKTLQQSLPLVLDVQVGVLQERENGLEPRHGHVVSGLWGGKGGDAVGRVARRKFETGKGVLALGL